MQFCVSANTCTCFLEEMELGSPYIFTAYLVQQKILELFLVDERALRQALRNSTYTPARKNCPAAKNVINVHCNAMHTVRSVVSST